MIRDRVDIEKHRARDMGREIFSPGVAVLRGQIIRAVDDHDVGLPIGLRAIRAI